MSSLKEESIIKFVERNYIPKTKIKDAINKLKWVKGIRFSKEVIIVDDLKKELNLDKD